MTPLGPIYCGMVGGSTAICCGLLRNIHSGFDLLFSVVFQGSLILLDIGTNDAKIGTVAVATGNQVNKFVLI